MLAVLERLPQPRCDQKNVRKTQPLGGARKPICVPVPMMILGVKLAFEARLKNAIKNLKKL